MKEEEKIIYTKISNESILFLKNFFFYLYFQLAETCKFCSSWPFDRIFSLFFQYYYVWIR